MYDYKDSYRKKIAEILTDLLGETSTSMGAAGNDSITPAQVVAEIPPGPEMGDLGFPMFGYAKLLRKAPPQIAQMVAAKLPGSFAVGPYVNVRLDRAETAAHVLGELLGESAQAPGRPSTLKGSRIMVEFSSPNTNKPLHLGHLRNDVLGESISRILVACGAEVRKVCIINDRGIHICKSMLAYMEHGEGKTPESEGVKSDHFVGDWYVRFSKDLKEETEALKKEKGLNDKEAEAQASVLQKAQELLRKWEAGDGETVELWKKMNAWAIDGWKETYKRTGVSFDQYYFESKTYLLGKDEILKGLEKGIFSREEDGSVQVDLADEKLGKKVLLRKDGTSIYITQDLGTAIYRHEDWPFDRLVFVVGSEQQYHFKVLFVLLQKLGFEWARNLYHLSYGMVNLPEGKMKSREGTVVDADDLIDSLKEMALEEIRGKEREEAVGDPEAAAEKIAIGALHYYLLQVSPSKDMLFDPKESLSFNGNTGPYLQYMGARISSLLRKAEERGNVKAEAGSRFDSRRGLHTPPLCGDHGVCNPSPTPYENNIPRRSAAGYVECLCGDAEWELIKTLGAYDDAVAAAAAGMDPSLLAGYLYELAKGFSRFYHECPILNAEDSGVAAARLALSRAVLLVLTDALDLVCIPFLEVM